MAKAFFDLRPRQEGDDAFILDSWRKSHGTGGSFRYEDPPLVREICLKVATTVVAVNSYNPDQIIGWICFETLDEPLVHFLFVKRFSRRRGVARALLDAASCEKGVPFKTSHPTYAHEFLPMTAVPIAPWRPRKPRRKKRRRKRKKK